MDTKSPKEAFTARDGALWVFPDGSNHQGEYMGCIDAGDINEPAGDVALIQCFDPDGEFKVVGETEGAPGPVTTDLTQLTYRTRAWLERLRGQYGLVFLQRDGGRADVFTNWKRALILDGCENTSRTYGKIVQRETVDPSTRGFAITANTPVIRVMPVHGQRLGGDDLSLEPNTINDVAMLKEPWGIYPARYGVAVCAAGAGVPADVYITLDGGHNFWAVSSPFGNDVPILSCAILDMGDGSRRIIVGADAGYLASVQGLTAYSDDDGATWTVVNIGGATDGHGSFSAKTIIALDPQHVWLVSTLGFVYFSDDAGESWVAQESGGITIDDYYSICMCSDGQVGYAVTGSGLIIKTINGGATWVSLGILPFATSGKHINTIDGQRVWVGGENTLLLLFSEDGGLTWTSRTGFPGSGVNNIQQVIFVNMWVGYLITSAPIGSPGYLLRTIDGGYTWEQLAIPPNNGLVSMDVCDENYLVMVGVPDALAPFYAFSAVFEE